MTQVRIDQVCKRYSAQAPLTLKDVSITIDPGEFCVFVGPSGCGKSTLLRLLAGLDDVSSGHIKIGGRDVTGRAPSDRGVAMVFQSYALYPHMTVEQNMAFGLQVRGADRKGIAAKVALAAERLQLTPLLQRLPRELSGGQRQRVAIGRAIVKQPQVFLFDEPLSNLDAALRVQTRLEIAKLHRELAAPSMVYVTHDQVEAMTLADKIVLLRSGPEVQTLGSVAQIGSPMDLYHRPSSVFAAQFIGSPRMNLLPAHLVRIESGLATVDVGGLFLQVAVHVDKLPVGSPVQLGVRPEHIRLSNGPNGLTAVVQHLERLGDATLIYLQTCNGLPSVVLRCEGHVAPAIGETVPIQLPPESLHLFDAEGQACTRSVPSLPR